MAVAFDNVTMDEAVAQAVENLQSKRRCMVVTPNAEIAQSCVTDDRLREIVRKAGLVLPDGIGVIYASRILKKPLKQRVPGVEFGENLVSALRDTGKTIFFLGGKPGVAEEAAHRLQVKYPGLKVAGTKDGYFQREEEAVEAVQQAKPDVLFVCLGSPKQEYFMADHFDQLGATLMVGLGGSLDVYAGKVERAPALFRKLGLEWFYRLLRQPSRLGRMMKLPQYLWQSIRWRMKGEK
ncbi:MAG TPA: WecB/TagA/CpsF family glycosyltransferase [Firmicutes bacterium]|nr:WecB/TagA/CpsF family glycosyltransferase [Bacillota bacterium]